MTHRATGKTTSAETGSPPGSVEFDENVDFSEDGGFGTDSTWDLFGSWRKRDGVDSANIKDAFQNKLLAGYSSGAPEAKQAKQFGMKRSRIRIQGKRTLTAVVTKNGAAVTIN